jgi:hypothetical protein
VAPLWTTHCLSGQHQHRSCFFDLLSASASHRRKTAISHQNKRCIVNNVFVLFTIIINIIIAIACCTTMQVCGKNFYTSIVGSVCQWLKKHLFHCFFQFNHYFYFNYYDFLLNNVEFIWFHMMFCQFCILHNRKNSQMSL